MRCYSRRRYSDRLWGEPCTSSAWTALDRQPRSTHWCHHTTLGMGSRGAPSLAARLLPPGPRWAVGYSHLRPDWRGHIPTPPLNPRPASPLSRASIFTSPSSDPVGNWASHPLTISRALSAWRRCRELGPAV